MFDRKRNKKEQKKENWRFEAQFDRPKNDKGDKRDRDRVKDLLRTGEYDSEDLYE